MRGRVGGGMGAKAALFSASNPLRRAREGEAGGVFQPGRRGDKEKGGWRRWGWGYGRRGAPTRPTQRPPVGWYGNCGANG